MTPRVAGVAAHGGDLDSLEGPGFPERAASQRGTDDRDTNGRGEPASTIGRLRGRRDAVNEDGGNGVTTRLATAWTRTRVAGGGGGVAVVSGIRFVGSRGAGALLGAAGCATAPGVLPPVHDSL